MKNFYLLSVIVMFASGNVVAQSYETELDQLQIRDIETKIQSMNAEELKDARFSLQAEKELLLDEQANTQNPSQLKSIGTRISAINAELSAIQRALLVLVGLGVIDSVTDDGYDDNVPPVITINGSATVTVELGTSYTDEGATANDAFHGSTPVSSSGTVDTNSVGTYIITYTATDLDGNTATATRTVNVVDTTAPVITVTGSDVSLERGTTYTDAGATASDASGTVTVVTTGTNRG